MEKSFTDQCFFSVLIGLFVSWLLEMKLCNIFAGNMDPGHCLQTLLVCLLVGMASANWKCRNRNCDWYYRRGVYCRTWCCLRKVPREIPVDSQRVVLDNNKISHISSYTFHYLSKCTKLSLCCQQISTIQPGAFNGLVSLTHLSIHTNQICSLHMDIFSELFSLKTLLIHDNPLKVLDPAVLKNLPRPLEFSMTYHFSGKPLAIWDCESLCWLKHEEQQGTITWWEPRKTRQPQTTPLCRMRLKWKNLQCPKKGGGFYSTQYFRTTQRLKTPKEKSHQRKTVIVCGSHIHFQWESVVLFWATLLSCQRLNPAKSVSVKYVACHLHSVLCFF